MGKFCGTAMPPLMTSSDYTMTVFFRSDHSVAHDGFMASYVLLNSTAGKVVFLKSLIRNSCFLFIKVIMLLQCVEENM